MSKKTPREIGNANLKPYKKGQSGNPSGRSKQPLSDAMRRFLNRNYRPSGKIKLDPHPTVADAIARATAEAALAGDVSAIRELGDRTEGKPSQRIELSGSEDGAPIQIDTVDLSRLSKDELLTYRAILAKAARRNTE